MSEEPEAGIARMLEPVHLYVAAPKYDVSKLKNNICRLLYDGRTTQGFGVTKEASHTPMIIRPQKCLASKDHAGRRNISE